MKKHKVSRSKIVLPKTKTKLIGSLAAMLLVAIAGFITLHFGFAYNETQGDIVIRIQDSSTGKRVPNVTVNLQIMGAPAYSCGGGMQSVTNSNGEAAFTNCAPTTAVYFIEKMNLSAVGYAIDPASFTKTGTHDGQVYTVTNQSIAWQVLVKPLDNDGDGVPNNSDSCINTAGPASNAGCPVPAPTPSTPAPSTTAPTTTTKAPASSSPTTKKTTTPNVPQTKTPAVVVATSGDTTPPSSPGSIIVSQVDNEVFISWDDSTDNTGVSGYNIYRSTDNKSWSRIGDDIKSTYYTDSNVSTDTHYYYKVEAKDTAGNISEGVIEDIKLVSAKSESTSKSKPKTASPKSKNSSGVALGVSIAIILAIGLALGALFLRRRIQSNNEPYSYDVSSISAPPIPSTQATSHDPQQYNQPIPGQPPQAHLPNNGAPNTAEHTSVSLKEMVMEEMNKQNHNLPPSQPPPSPKQ